MKRLYSFSEQGEYGQLDTPAKDALLHRAAEMLRKHEWSGWWKDPWGHGEEHPMCPECGALKVQPHKPDCALDALIRELESRLAL